MLNDTAVFVYDRKQCNTLPNNFELHRRHLWCPPLSIVFITLTAIYVFLPNVLKRGYQRIIGYCLMVMNFGLQFIGRDPGAVKNGNFINYYQFHSSESRVKCLPTDVWKVNYHSLLCLDVGCNSGELTQEVYQFLGECMKEKLDDVDISCYFLAIDLDPVLTSRAREANMYRDNITYECMDIFSETRDSIFTQYLRQKSRAKFDIAFCFSVTMWIHLNHGDDGLIQFLVALSQWADTLVIEPQPWKCYRTAAEETRRHGEHFPHYEVYHVARHASCNQLSADRAVPLLTGVQVRQECLG